MNIIEIELKDVIGGIPNVSTIFPLSVLKIMDHLKINRSRLTRMLLNGWLNGTIPDPPSYKYLDDYWKICNVTILKSQKDELVKIEEYSIFEIISDLIIDWLVRIELLKIEELKFLEDQSNKKSRRKTVK